LFLGARIQRVNMERTRGKSGKHLCQHFKLDESQQCFEVLLKDHVTLKTGVISAENSALSSQE